MYIITINSIKINDILLKLKPNVSLTCCMSWHSRIVRCLRKLCPLLYRQCVILSVFFKIFINYRFFLAHMYTCNPAFFKTL